MAFCFLLHNCVVLLVLFGNVVCVGKGAAEGDGVPSGQASDKVTGQASDKVTGQASDKASGKDSGKASDSDHSADWMNGKKIYDVDIICHNLHDEELKQGMFRARFDDNKGWCWDYYEAHDWNSTSGTVREGAPWAGSYPLNEISMKRDNHIVETVFVKDPPGHNQRRYTITFPFDKQAKVFTGESRGK